jgi:hypothetical protein
LARIAKSMLATSTMATSATRFPTTYRDFPTSSRYRVWGIAALATGVR